MTALFLCYFDAVFFPAKTTNTHTHKMKKEYKCRRYKTKNKRLLTAPKMLSGIRSSLKKIRDISVNPSTMLPNGFSAEQTAHCYAQHCNRKREPNGTKTALQQQKQQRRPERLVEKNPRSVRQACFKKSRYKIRRGTTKDKPTADRGDDGTERVSRSRFIGRRTPPTALEPAVSEAVRHAQSEADLSVPVQPCSLVDPPKGKGNNTALVTRTASSSVVSGTANGNKKRRRNRAVFCSAKRQKCTYQ